MQRCSDDTCHELLEQVELGEAQQDVTLRSGRRFELSNAGDYDHLVVRASSGRVLLRVTLSDRGPLLVFDNAEVSIRAREHLRLSAPTVTVSARDELRLQSAGDMSAVIAGDHHTCIAGEERLEAAAVAIQANEGDVAIQAMDAVHLDGEHIGLNDQPCPRPFHWSRLAAEEHDHDD